MPAQLVALTEGPNILLDKPILLLGRHAECDIQLNSRKVSRRHCCIAQVSNYLVVRDLGSTNGIRINGVRVLEGRLKGGDELTVGNFRYQVNCDGNVATPPKQAPQSAHPPKPNQAPARKAVSPQSGTESDDDAILESCDDPVMLGKPGKKPGPQVDLSPHFPDNVNLLSGDSKHSPNPDPAN
jgi:pSer/pThr/pTyr-binding forkhead associated (FHA) protein